MDHSDNNEASKTLKNTFEAQFQEAVKWHKAGDIARAKKLYKHLFDQQPKRVDLMHNLGMVMLGLGELRRGAELVKIALAADPENPGMSNSAKLVAMELYKHGYWEDSEQWLQKAINVNPTDRETLITLQRVAKRDYLKPERYSALEKQTLIRSSPREAPNYMYIIDIVGKCNLACPTCPVGNSHDDERKQTLMSIDNFKKILNKIDAEKPSPGIQIHLYNWGEPLLHPQLPRFIKLIREYGFTSHISTNLNIEKGLKELVKAAPNDLKISISGFSEETYSLTHSKGNIHLVKSNMYKLRQYINQYKNNKNIATHVWIGHHLYKNNMHEQEEIITICKELGFKYSAIQAFYQPLEKLISLAEGDLDLREESILNNLLKHPKEQLQFATKYKDAHYDCELRFNQTVINTNGTVALCCSQYQTKNMLGVDFLKTKHKDIEDLKYSQKLCFDCRKHGLDYSPKKLPDSLHMI